MAFVIKHTPRYDTAGQVALDAGRGQYRQRTEELQRGDAQFGAQLQQRERLALLDMQQREISQLRSLDAQFAAQQSSQQDARQRMFLGAQLDAGRQQMGHQFALEQGQQGAELEMGAREKLFEQQMEQEGLRFTAQQKRMIAQINESTQWVNDQVASGAWTPEEADFARRQLEAQRLGIQPMPSADDPSPWPKGRGVGDQWIDRGRIWTRDHQGVPKDMGVVPDWPSEQGIGKVWRDGGAVMTRNSKGEVDVLMEPPDPPKPEAQKPMTFPDFNKLYTDVRDSMKSVNAETGAETFPAHEHILQEIQRREAAFGNRGEGEAAPLRAAGREIYDRARGMLDRLLPGMFPPGEQVDDEDIDELVAGMQDAVQQNVERDEFGQPVLRDPEHPELPPQPPPRRIETEEQYAALAPGTPYIHPDGTLRVKQ